MIASARDATAATRLAIPRAGRDGVEGQDQRRRQAFRREVKRPGGAEFARMNNVDCFLAHDPHEATAVSPHRQRVGGGGGKRDPHPATRLQFPDEPAAIRCDESARADLGEGGRDLDRVTPGIAAVQSRHDLQDGGARQGFDRHALVRFR